MPVSPAVSLITPDNRLLGWALTDLTLYGAPASAEMIVRPAGADPTLEAPTALAGGDAPATTAPADGQVFALNAFSPGDRAASTPQLFTAAPIAPTALHAAEPSVTPSTPPPIGSGGALQPLVATPLQTVEDAGHVGTTGLPTSIDAGPIAALDPASAHMIVAQPATEIVTTIGTATGLVDALAAPVAGLVNDVTHGVTSALDAIATPDLETAALAHDVGLDGLSGSNPAAGVATLVGMVASADAFDLSHASAPPADASAPSIVDALAADEAPSPLLGDHHDATGLGHLADDHGVHLGL